VVEEIGDSVKTMKVGDFLVGSFVISDNTCEICRASYQSRAVCTANSSPRPSTPRRKGPAIRVRVVLDSRYSAGTVDLKPWDGAAGWQWAIPDFHHDIAVTIGPGP